ncbi:MAG: AAA family ATPase, partial [Caldilineaceae bacterium]|nr:AAA family ATPase [Caldilineaceae bacterium]
MPTSPTQATLLDSIQHTTGAALLELRIRNFAIIDELQISFHSGLNVITGETGAGKSIIIDALGLLLGDRATEEMIRAETDRAEIEGVFRINTAAAEDSAAADLAAAVRAGDRRALARAITLVESTRDDHREAARALIAALLPDTGRSVRLGITGVPGVGKSTF